MSPAVNLDLEEVPFAILETVKARIMANRRRLAQGRNEQKPPPSLKPRPQLRRFGADSKTYRRPEPAATGGDLIKAHNAVYFGLELAGYDDGMGLQGFSNQLVLTFFSGDANASLAFTSPMLYVPESLLVDASPVAEPLRAAGLDISAVLVVLPINTDSVIVVVNFICRAFAEYFSGSIYDPRYPNYGNPPTYESNAVAHNNIHYISNKAYYVGRSTVKEIALPSRLEVKMQPLPRPSTTPTRIGYFSWLVSQQAALRYQIQTDGFGGALSYAPTKFSDISARDYYVYGAPETMDDSNTYRYFGGIPPIPLTNAVRGVPASGPGVYGSLLEFDDSAYQPTTSYAPSGIDDAVLLKFNGPEDPEPTYYPIDGADNPVWRKAATNNNFAQRPTYGDPGGNAGQKRHRTFYWDWGKPAYCRQQLLALGFTDADLRP